jgi:hypothetical protein
MGGPLAASARINEMIAVINADPPWFRKNVAPDIRLIEQT